MKVISGLALLILLFPACARKTDDSDVQAIKKTMEAYSDAINGRKADAAVAMMTENTFCAEPNSPSMTGKDAIRKRIQSIFDRLASHDLDFRAPVSDVQVQGELGAARGSWAMNVRPRSGVVAPVRESGSWALICRRQGGGSWKWDSVVVTSEQPLPGKTPTGEDEHALLMLEQDLAAGMAKGQTKEQAQRRAQVLGSLAKSYNLSAVTVRDLNPYVFGDAAIVNILGEMQGDYNGQATSGTLRGVDFFVRRDGRWQLVYSQNTVSIP